MRKTLAAAAALALLSTPVAADVTITATTTGKGLGQSAAGQSVTYVKGNKMRSEARVGDRTLISVIDLDAQKMLSIDPKKREAESYDLAKIRTDMEKAIGGAEPTVSFTPTGQKKTVMGTSCEVYSLALSMPSKQAGMEMTVTMSGPVCVAKGMKGFDDYARFFRTAAEKGMIFNSPQQAKAQPGQARGMAEMYRTFAATGMPLEQDITIKVQGSGPLAGMMGRIGNMSMGSTTTSVSTEPLPDDLFAVPADYKVKVR